MRHAACGMRHAACGMRHAACGIEQSPVAVKVACARFLMVAQVTAVLRHACPIQNLFGGCGDGPSKVGAVSNDWSCRVRFARWPSGSDRAKGDRMRKVLNRRLRRNGIVDVITRRVCVCLGAFVVAGFSMAAPLAMAAPSPVDSAIAWGPEQPCLETSTGEISARACPANQEYKICGPKCEPTVANPNPDCEDSGCVKGCFCKKGYIRDKPNGKCIPKDDAQNDE
ncbi:hypothetical protein F3087_33990 [Nocardia colli]|uniref:TIL domain-containing protein n=1 Tax=Nocardia colli TaxID=2545717 RepID=A0A5N0E475_9NOCA|nr:hypothetical protein F3087_33990 [Nocardia colli]